MVRFTLRFTSQNRRKMTPKSMKSPSKIVPKMDAKFECLLASFFLHFRRFWASLLGPLSAIFRNKWRYSNCPFCVRHVFAIFGPFGTSLSPFWHLFGSKILPKVTKMRQKTQKKNTKKSSKTLIN